MEEYDFDLHEKKQPRAWVSRRARLMQAQFKCDNVKYKYSKKSVSQNQNRSKAITKLVQEYNKLNSIIDMVNHFAHNAEGLGWEEDFFDSDEEVNDVVARTLVRTNDGRDMDIREE